MGLIKFSIFSKFPIASNDSNNLNDPTRELNLRHESAAPLCHFDWLLLGIVHTKYALCSRFAQSLQRIATLSFSEELLTSNNKPPLQKGGLRDR